MLLPPPSAPDHPPRHEVVVVGAGLSGIGAALALREAGVGDVLLLEQADDLGGTWRDNTYPGCACDVPSRLYSYSFAPRASWSRAFAGQREILDYVHTVADIHGVRRQVRFGTRLTDARWDPARAEWRVTTTAGPLRCRFLVSAAGPWHEPRVPDLPGLSGFPGRVFHSSRWDHDVDLTDARVAVVGTGASAVQFVPEIQPRVARLHVFQRTASWVLPKPDRVTSAVGRRVAALPGYPAAARAAQAAALEAFGLALRHPWLLGPWEALGRAHLRVSVPDPQLRRALTPDHRLGCKRLLLSNDYLRALGRPNVEVHATAVARLEGPRVVGCDGSLAEVDVVVLGTGFRILDMPIAGLVRDAAGRSLAEHWGGSPEAYRGTLVAGFPNLFLLLGPGLGTGHSSAFTILEAQLRLLTAAVAEVRRSGAVSVEVRAAAQQSHVTRVQDALPGTVYNAGGCQSYYRDRNGRNSFSWPWSTRRLVREVSRLDRDHLWLRRAGADEVPPVGLEPTLRGF